MDQATFRTLIILLMAVFAALPLIALIYQKHKRKRDKGRVEPKPTAPGEPHHHGSCRT